MTDLQFKLPRSEVTFTWKLGESLLYRSDGDPVGLDRSTQRGELFHRFLNFKIVDRFGFSSNVTETQTEIKVRSYIPKIMELLGEKNRQGIIRTIPNGGGYQWLPGVEKMERDLGTADIPTDANPGEDRHSPKAAKPLFLNGNFAEDTITHSLFPHTIDSSSLISEKTRDFVGRDYISDEIKAFVHRTDCGYFVIKGDPGIGKTALMAHLANKHHWVHHFNVRGEGIVRPDQFWQNLCAQLIIKYQLPYRDLPPEATRDVTFFKGLLAEVAAKLPDDGRAIILVDALDEVKSGNAGANTLFLPLTLPRGIHFVVTMRDSGDVRLRFDCAHTFFKIEHDGKDNLNDVGKYITLKMTLPGIDSYIRRQEMGQSDFIGTMTEKSEGNFMYLRHVLPEIAEGAYRNRPIEFMPSGLKSYYTDHWWRMRGLNEEAWETYRLPVVLALTIVREPVSFEMISRFSGVKASSHIHRVLADWRQFLHIRDVVLEDHRQKRYRIYHTSYQDFIKDMDVVKAKAAERGFRPQVDLKRAHEMIADVLMKDLVDAGILDDSFTKDIEETPPSD